MAACRAVWVWYQSAAQPDRVIGWTFSLACMWTVPPTCACRLTRSPTGRHDSADYGRASGFVVSFRQCSHDLGPVHLTESAADQVTRESRLREVVQLFDHIAQPTLGPVAMFDRVRSPSSLG